MAKFFKYEFYQVAVSKLNETAATGDADAIEDVKSLEHFVNGCCSYVKQVDEMESALKLSRFYLDGEAYRDKIASLDRTRRAIHDGVIAELRMMERLLALYDLKPFFAGNVDDRYEVADFCGEVSNTLFVNRQS